MPGMYDPTMRVLATLELLEGHEAMTGPELARRLEVSPRTVQRYIVRLQDLGVPVEGTRGVGGAYRLKPGFRLPPMVFNDDEALAIMLGLRALRHLGLGSLAPAEASAAAKLERVLPKAVREGLLETLEVLKLESSPWVVPTNAELVKRLARAAQGGRVVELTYRTDAGERSVRQIEPYGVLHHDGRWYVVAYCRLRSDVRVFRVDRVQTATMLETTFKRPNDFDAKAFLLSTLPFQTSSWQIEVWVDLERSRLQERVPPGRVVLIDEAHGTLLKAQTANLEWMAAMLLSLQCPLEVRSPLELREAFGRLADQAQGFSERK
jgi:predicted DNA-binding transcriptional regulator YafY